jgi:glycosyltransferase involved in cell wall biosynthesis
VAVPFGFGPRFTNSVPWPERCRKVVAIGAINPLDPDRLPDPGIIREYLEFYREFPYSQMWRHTLSNHESELDDLLASYLPKAPQISRPGDDPVELLNRFAMYANDESICGFPPARTYEGAACGAVMVSSPHECFRELGFEDGQNCIMHRPMDVESFREKVRHYLARPAELEAIAQRGCEMVRSRYTHEQVARRLHSDILARCAA